MTTYNREVLVEILVYHYRKENSSCGCGWAEFGRSHCEHVANVYEESMVMREENVIKDRVQHASCACLYPPGEYPIKALCGLIIDDNKHTSTKCPECVKVYGRHPCVLCPADCENC